MTHHRAPALPQPDFLRPARREGSLAWLACASALLVLGLASVDAWTAWQAHQQAQDRLLQGQRRAVEQTRARSAIKAGQAPGASAAPPSAARAWLQRLDRPWPANWAASEAASVEGIAWRSMDLRDNGQLRLQGQAAETGLALDAGRVLRGQAQAGRSVWREVVVARIDRQDRGQQFEIQARLNGPEEPVSAGASLAPGAGAAAPLATRPAWP